YQFTTWYIPTYPPEYQNLPCIYVCDKCLKYMKNAPTYRQHKSECTVTIPPGHELYRDHKLRIYELDGKHHKLYCQNLCLFAKLFLDNKTVFYDIDRFVFYILAEVDICDGETTTRLLGYFSKEKTSQENYNLACIVVLPPYQGQGYGNLLIELSYHLTLQSKGRGTPERPLSHQAQASFRKYWQRATLMALRELSQEYVSLATLSQMTGMVEDDLLTTLFSLGL
ncbi:acyl-CoA N-acyltransferase, partial [Dimargaris cristalligena]